MMTNAHTTNDITESRLGLIGGLGDRIHDCLAPYISQELPLAIVDFPDIRNCGDSAIWLGEVAYLKQRFNKRADYVSRIVDFSAEELERRVPEGPVFIHGGGNFGDIWVAHQDFREAILERFPNRQIIQLPQSIHYDSPQRVEQSEGVAASDEDRLCPIHRRGRTVGRLVNRIDLEAHAREAGPRSGRVRVAIPQRIRHK